MCILALTLVTHNLLVEVRETNMPVVGHVNVVLHPSRASEDSALLVVGLSLRGYDCFV